MSILSWQLWQETFLSFSCFSWISKERFAMYLKNNVYVYIYIYINNFTLQPVLNKACWGTISAENFASRCSWTRPSHNACTCRVNARYPQLRPSSQRLFLEFVGTKEAALVKDHCWLLGWNMASSGACCSSCDEKSSHQVSCGTAKVFAKSVTMWDWMTNPRFEFEVRVYCKKSWCLSLLMLDSG